MHMQRINAKRFKQTIRNNGGRSRFPARQGLENFIKQKMARISQDYCNKCSQETQHINNRCVPCAVRETRQEMAAWQALTIEEKLLDIHKRLLKLEAGPQKYA